MKCIFPKLQILIIAACAIISSSQGQLLDMDETTTTTTSGPIDLDLVYETCSKEIQAKPPLLPTYCSEKNIGQPPDCKFLLEFFSTQQEDLFEGCVLLAELADSPQRIASLSYHETQRVLGYINQVANGTEISALVVSELNKRLATLENYRNDCNNNFKAQCAKEKRRGVAVHVPQSCELGQFEFEHMDSVLNNLQAFCTWHGYREKTILHQFDKTCWESAGIVGYIRKKC